MRFPSSVSRVKKRLPLISADETGRPMKDVYARVFTSIDNQPSSIRFVASPNEEATPTGHVDDGRYSLLQVGGKAMHELDYSSRSLMQLCKTRHPLCSIPRGYLIASALLP